MAHFDCLSKEIIFVEKNEESSFTLKDLKMFHGACGGGEITIVNDKANDADRWNCTCLRCRRNFFLWPSVAASISLTAIDGKDRDIHHDSKVSLKK